MIFSLLTEGTIFGVGFLVYKALYNGHTSSIPKDNTPFYYSNNSAANHSNFEGIKNNVSMLPVNSQEFSQTMLIFIIVVAVLTAVVLFVLYFLILTKKFSTYIEEIGAGINELSTGNFDTRIEIRNDDELTDIAQNLNKMAISIKDIIEIERKTENTKNELITNVAHDLRTPLTSIIGYLDLVSNNQLDEDTKSKYIDIAYNKSRRLEKLIDDLFAYTKFEFGEVKMHCGKVDIAKMLEQLLDEFYPSFIENELEYKFTTNEPSIILYADGDLLARAFANLIGNAIKYGISGKNIIICMQKNESHVQISVVNFGELIPKKDLTNIFNKFYRVDNSRNEGLGGTGLGLAIAKSIILLHKGNITAKSDFSGTVFEVNLPLFDEKSCKENTCES